MRFEIVREHCQHETGQRKHDVEYCCSCQHFHPRGTECPEHVPCGDMRCCVK